MVHFGGEKSGGENKIKSNAKRTNSTDQVLASGKITPNVDSNSIDLNEVLEDIQDMDIDGQI